MAPPTTPQDLGLRARICLLAPEGVSHRRIAPELKTLRPAVLWWRKRLATGGPCALKPDAPRGESPRRTDPEWVRAIVKATLHPRPPEATHGSRRSMAAKFGVSPTTVARIGDAHGLPPPRVRTFKLSGDPQFVEKLTDGVGWYMNPPDKALVLCVEEKSQIPALDRTQAGLPMQRGRWGTRTHDSVRPGTTHRFAARNVPDGTVMGGCFTRPGHEEFLRFLRWIDRQTPPGMDLHLIVDH